MGRPAAMYSNIFSGEVNAFPKAERTSGSTQTPASARYRHRSAGGTGGGELHAIGNTERRGQRLELGPPPRGAPDEPEPKASAPSEGLNENLHPLPPVEAAEVSNWPGVGGAPHRECCAELHPIGDDADPVAGGVALAKQRGQVPGEHEEARRVPVDLCFERRQPRMLPLRAPPPPGCLLPQHVGEELVALEDQGWEGAPPMRAQEEPGELQVPGEEGGDPLGPGQVANRGQSQEVERGAPGQSHRTPLPAKAGELPENEGGGLREAVKDRGLPRSAAAAHKPDALRMGRQARAGVKRLQGRGSGGRVGLRINVQNAHGLASVAS
jgi:hypothetical protein